MKNAILLLLILLPILGFSQVLTNGTRLEITKTWSQEPNGYTYPISIKVPNGEMPLDGFPVCILLHGNGGNGMGAIAQFSNVLECHILIGVTGYENSWNICAEDSEAPDVEMIDDLVNLLQDYTNLNPNQIRLLGSSNGASLVNRIFVENTNEGIDKVCAIVSHLNESQYRAGEFYRPSSTTDSATPYCGYDVPTLPLSSRGYLSISNVNDPIIPYNGGTSPVGVDFLPAEEAVYIIAKNQGYTGSQITTGNASGNPEIVEFSYLSGKVAHLRGDAGHGANITQTNYLKDFFSDCKVVSELTHPQFDEIKVFPNPTRTILSVERTSTQAMEYSILNILGQTVLSGVSTSSSLDIKLSHLPADLYFLRMNNQLIKLVKQN